MPNKDTQRPPLRITILLPLPGWKPVGGFKVAYEYANYLVAQGHTVNVIHANLPRIDKPLWSHPPRLMFHLLRRFYKLRSNRGYRPDAWFTVDPRVSLAWVPNLAPSRIPDADIVIATSWETAEWALTYPASKGRRFYLIQHLETWSGSAERVFDTWKAPLEKIVISAWLQRLAAEHGQSSHLVANGLDFRHFQLDIPPAGRDPNHLLMLHHLAEWKGTEDGLAAFVLARRSIPALRLTIFGVNPAPPGLPEGVDFHFRPTQAQLRQFYNEAAIFISPSWAEGWPLPPAEALLCGAALVSTDKGSDESYAVHEETALLSPIKDPQALASNILRLVRDTELRLKLSRQGHQAIQQFTWDRAGAAFEALLYAEADSSAPAPLQRESVSSP